MCVRDDAFVFCRDNPTGARSGFGGTGEPRHSVVGFEGAVHDAGKAFSDLGRVGSREGLGEGDGEEDNAGEEAADIHGNGPKRWCKGGGFASKTAAVPFGFEGVTRSRALCVLSGLVMEIRRWLPLLLMGWLVFGVGAEQSRGQSLEYEVAPEAWPEDFGSHRAVVDVREGGDGVFVRLPWRRRDREVEKKGVVIVHLDTGRRVSLVSYGALNREVGEVYFRPEWGPGEYGIHFLAGTKVGGLFKYVGVIGCEDKGWERRVRSEGGAFEVKVVRWESRTVHDRFSEMEVIATEKEKRAWVQANRGKRVGVFPEDRLSPVRMDDEVPERWVVGKPRQAWIARRGERYAFQVAVWAFRLTEEVLALEFSDLKGSQGTKISGESMRAHLLEGVDALGSPFRRTVTIPRGRVANFWCSADVPVSAVPGVYRGVVKVQLSGAEFAECPIELFVDEELIEEGGDSEPWRHSRLAWLDSRRGHGEAPMAPFKPIVQEGNALRFLGREVVLGSNGFPISIGSWFEPSVTRIGSQRIELLSAPTEFVVEGEDGFSVPFFTESVQFTKREAGEVRWVSRWTGQTGSGRVFLEVNGVLEAEGNLEFRCRLQADRENAGDIGLGDVRLEVHRTLVTSRFAAGMGLYGGERPDFMEWQWRPTVQNQDAFWMGSANAGLRVQLRDRLSERSLEGVDHRFRAMRGPESWMNGGSGGVHMEREVGTTDGGAVHWIAFSGARRLGAGQSVEFNFNLSVTPFRPFDGMAQTVDRIHQEKGVPSSAVWVGGANRLNVHHGNALNPFINYPYATWDRLEEFVKRSGKAGGRVGLYFGAREMSYRGAEFFAFRSFGEEVLMSGTGGGDAWLDEHTDGDYLAGTMEPSMRDGSVLMRPDSRYANYYVEGLDWLVRKTGISGVYMDGVGLDRRVMRRVRRVLEDRVGADQARVEVHGGNGMTARGGYTSTVVEQMEALPFVDRIWYGDGHSYRVSPEQMLVGVSGVPFGVGGTLMQTGGNIWTGLVFGMTGREGWGGVASPVWSVWDRFRVRGSEFIGWWDPACPVRMDRREVRVSVWKRRGAVLAAVANFSDQTVREPLTVYWNDLGLRREACRLYFPGMEGLQLERVADADAVVTLPPWRGALVWIDAETRRVADFVRKGNPSTGQLVMEQRFTYTPGSEWKVERSEAAKAPFTDGEGLVFEGVVDETVWAERRVPRDAGGIGVLLHCEEGMAGRSAPPGLQLVWKGGAEVAVFARDDGRVGVAVNGVEQAVGVVVPGDDLRLGIGWDAQEIRIFCTSGGEEEPEQELMVVSRKAGLDAGKAAFSGQPELVRVGRLRPELGLVPGSVPAGVGAGRLGVCRFDWLKVWRTP